MTLELFPSATKASQSLADFGVTDLSKICSISYHSEGIVGRSIRFRESSSVYFDDLDAQNRVVLHLAIETKTVGGKRKPVPGSLPRFRVSRLRGYDAVKNLWGTESHTDESVDLPLDVAAAFHKQFSEVRSSMTNHQGGGIWYRADLAFTR